MKYAGLSLCQLIASFEPILISKITNLITYHNVISCSTVSLSLNKASSALAVFERTEDSSGLNTIFRAVAFVPDPFILEVLVLSDDVESMTVWSEIDPVAVLQSVVSLSIVVGSSMTPESVADDSAWEGFVSGMIKRPDGEVRRKSGRAVGVWRWMTELVSRRWCRIMVSGDNVVEVSKSFSVNTCEVPIPDE